MGIVTAEESRDRSAGCLHSRCMNAVWPSGPIASPDGKWVLLAEIAELRQLGAVPRGSDGRQFSGPPGGAARG